MMRGPNRPHRTLAFLISSHTHARTQARARTLIHTRTLTMPGFPCPLACGGGKLPDAAVEAALPCAPPTLAALPRSLLAELGQSPVFFKPPSPARYTVVTDRAGDGLQVVMCVVERGGGERSERAQAVLSLLR